ncbi:helix-turn-helix domain-containing protein [Bacillus marinisedimentorum]|uniref:helix-turn-helix domain-containing protein n=1 Tax=Bacillus marinisedimentorum TaxID=1821260 RepID=UPI0007E0A3C8|nr:helix-turn-helix transcriptional regulator [Bacillus marinisedimentorum]
MEAEKWGRRIRAFRKLKGYTQEEFAKKTGISLSIFGEIERGNRKPSPQTVLLISEKLGVPADELTPD